MKSITLEKEVNNRTDNCGYDAAFVEKLMRIAFSFTTLLIVIAMIVPMIRLTKAVYEEIKANETRSVVEQRIEGSHEEDTSSDKDFNSFYVSAGTMMILAVGLGMTLPRTRVNEEF